MKLIENVKRIKELKKELINTLNEKANEFGYEIKDVDLADKKIIKNGDELNVKLAVTLKKI